MKLIAQVKLQPTHEQIKPLLETISWANYACKQISKIAWDEQTFGQFKLQSLVYHQIREECPLSAQLVVRCIAKVANAYKLDKKVKRTFRAHGAIAFDDRILSWKEDTVSIWTGAGRLKIPFVCGERQKALLQSRMGESDLVYARGSFYLLAVCDIPDPSPDETDDILGIDFGIVNIITDSEDKSYSGEKVNETRRKMSHRRRNLQKKGTRSAKRKLKQLSGKQRRYQKDVNHCLSKQIVCGAKGTKRAVAIEDLKHIRKRVTVRKSQRARLSNWAFGQLRSFIEYKARLQGVKVIKVDPRNTSRECSQCHHVDKKNRQSQDKFLCQSCGHTANADFNAALNIRARAMSISQTLTSVSKAA